jgi:hypothetical protein
LIIAHAQVGHMAKSCLNKPLDAAHAQQHLHFTLPRKTHSILCITLLDTFLLRTPLQVRHMVNAGMDLIMCPQRGATPDILHPATVAAVCSASANVGAVAKGCGAKCIPLERLDEAVGNVLTAKAELGLLTTPGPLTADM